MTCARSSRCATSWASSRAQLSTGSLAESRWYEYGGLLVNLRNIVDAGIGIAEWTSEAPLAPRRRARYEMPKRVLKLDRERASGRIAGRLSASVHGLTDRV